MGQYLARVSSGYAFFSMARFTIPPSFHSLPLTRKLIAGAFLGAFGVACGPAGSLDMEEGDVESRELNLNSVHTRIFDFENVSTDWASTGASIGTTTNASHGATALSIRPSGWTEIVSDPVSSLGELEPNVTIDVKPGSAMSWGEVRLVLRAPSINLSYQELGSQSLVGVPAGTYRKLSFTIPAAVLTKLAQTYSDLTVAVVFNTPQPTSPHHVDNLTFSPKATSPTLPAPPGTAYGTLSLQIPSYAHPSRSALTALRELRVNDRARVEDFKRENYANVVNLGPWATNLGVDSRVRDLTSDAAVVMRDRAIATGDALTETPIQFSPGADVLGSTRMVTDIPDPAVIFTLNQSPATTDVSSATNRNPTPGRYRHVRVDGAYVTFKSGVYSLDSLYISSQKQLLIDATNGPVVVLVSGTVAIHGQVQDFTGGLTPYPNWILAYSGNSEVHFNSSLDGSVFAPFAKVSAGAERRHEGTVFAKDIEIHQASVFAHAIRPSHWRELCKVFNGRGGFCSALADAEEGCLHAVQPTFTGRNGHDPIGFANERTIRGFASAFDTHLGDFVNQEADNEIGISASVWANLDSDPEQELVVGFTSTPNGGRRGKVYDDSKHGFRLIQDLFEGWGAQFGVTSMDAADIDGDGIEEVAVGRNSPGGSHEVEVLKVSALTPQACSNGPHFRLDTIKSLDVGDRTVTGVAFGDVDNDGSVDLALSRTGRTDNNVPRVMVFRVGKFAPAEWDTNPNALMTAAGWARELDATAIAIGDLENDGVTDLAVGVDDSGGDRWEVYNFSKTANQLQRVHAGGNGWGDDRRTTAVAFGDLDGNGDDELIVGRDENDDCWLGECNAGPRAYVLDVNDQGAIVELKNFGSNWGNERRVTTIATGDTDGDGRDEIFLGRSEGDGPRVYVHAGPDRNFDLLRTEGDGWGNDRAALTISTGDRGYCLAFDPERRPASWGEAKLNMPSRLQGAIRTQVQTYLDKMDCSADADTVLGRWRDDDDVKESGQAMQRIIAGYAALQLGQAVNGAAQPEIPSLAGIAAKLNAWGFREKVGEYLAKAKQLKPVGTHADFDFAQMSLAGLLYRYRTTKLSNNQFLLTDAAFENIRKSDCTSICLSSEPGCLKPPEERICGNRSEATNLVYEYFVDIPETENHVLMINTWHYLMAQLDSTPTARGQTVASAPTNDLETKLLEVIGRIVKNDMWETNALAYGTFSIRPLQLLASYAVASKVKIAAQNAMDFLATKYAFQSLHGKRSAPMRRNWKYRQNYSLYQSDYASGQLGILSGDYLYKTPDQCAGESCVLTPDSQILSFALESGLAKYRIPDVVVEHMLNPDVGGVGFGSWARMQARYSEGDYKVFDEPNYASAGGLPREPAQEFYFRTAGYLNAAGGRHESYHTFGDQMDDVLSGAELALLSLPLPINVFGPPGLQQIIAALAIYFSEDDIKKAQDETIKGTDFLSKPTTLLGGADTRWGSVGTAEIMTPLFRGNHGEFWHSNNTGVYKNFALGFSTEREGFFLPPAFKVAASATVGKVDIRVLDPESTLALFPRADYFVLVGTIREPGAGRKSLGFYEVVPRSKFVYPAVLLAVAQQKNSSWSSNPFRYVTALSGETIEINPAYPSGNPFLSIGNGSLHDVHSANVSTGELAALLDVREVNDNLAFTGHHYACARGGLLIVNPAIGGKRLVVDSRDPQNPTRCETQAIVANDCKNVLEGAPVATAVCPTQ